MPEYDDTDERGEEYEAAKPRPTNPQPYYPYDPWHTHDDGICLACEGRKAADADIKRIEESDGVS